MFALSCFVLASAFGPLPARFQSVAASPAQECKNTEPPRGPDKVAFSAVFGEIITYRLAVTDYSDDKLTFSLTNSSDGGPKSTDINPQTGVVTFQVLLIGTITFTINATDCRNQTLSVPITITVTENENRPVIDEFQYSNKGGVSIRARESKIRVGSTLQVSQVGSSTVNTFPLSFKGDINRDQGRWYVTADTLSTQGNLLKRAFPKNTQLQIVVVSDFVPSLPFLFTRTPK